VIELTPERGSIDAIINGSLGGTLSFGSPNSDSHERRVRVEAPQVCHVARNNQTAVRARDRYDGGIDDVSRACHRQKFTTHSRKRTVQRNDSNVLAASEAGEPRLPLPVSPSLAERACGHEKMASFVEKCLDQCDHAAITSVERNQGSCVEDYLRLAFAIARFAHWTSLLVGSPSSAFSSASKSRRDSRCSFSTNAPAM
jgi:hypothetical protein